MIPLLIERLFPGAPAMGWDPLPALQGVAAGAAVTLLFTLPPLLGLRGVRPNLIFRREMAESAPPRRRRAQLLAAAAILAGVGLLAVWLVEGSPRHALRLGLYFTVGLAVGLAALAGIARLMLAALRALLRRARLPLALRHGFANLYRPGNHATAVLVALGVGVMFILTVFLLERALAAQMAANAPRGMPNVFLLDIPAPDRAEVVELAGRQPGVEQPPELMSAVAMRLVSVDGVTVKELGLERRGRRYLRTRTVTWMAAKPPDLLLVRGAWWEASPRTEGPRISVEEDAAGILGVKPGSVMLWDAWGRKVEARVAAVHRSEGARMSSRFEFIFSPGALEEMPAVYYGAMRVRPPDVAALQRVMYDRYPTVTVVNVADVLAVVQQVVDQVAVLYRFLSLFTVLAGAVILASSVAGTRFRRIREVAVLKALGATRRRVAEIFSIEFLLLGAVAGVMGSLLAMGFTSAVLKGLLEVPYRPDLLPAAVAVVLTALMAIVTGWLASWRILGRRPLEVLREE